MPPIMSESRVLLCQFLPGMVWYCMVWYGMVWYVIHQMVANKLYASSSVGDQGIGLIGTNQDECRL